jgi:nicotinamidase-related amidase
MTTFENRPNTALIIVDVQQDVVAQAHARDAVVANINLLVAKARAAGVPVIWVQHSDDDLVRGTDGWELMPELHPAPNDVRIDKAYGDAFEDTVLAERLAELRVGRLFVAGAETDACIRSTIHGAFTRGYDVILVSDAHTTGDKTERGAPEPAKVIAHTNLYWTYHTGPGRSAGVAKTADVDFQAPSSQHAPTSQGILE